MRGFCHRLDFAASSMCRSRQLKGFAMNRSIFSLRRAFLSAVVLALAAGGAQAVTYRGIIEYKDASGPQQNDVSTSTQATYTYASGGNLAISKTLSGAGGSVFSSTISSPVGTPYVIARSIIRYNIRLVGPDGGPVGVRVVANGYAQGAGVPYSYAADASFTLRFSSDSAFSTG